MGEISIGIQGYQPQRPIKHAKNIKIKHSLSESKACWQLTGRDLFSRLFLSRRARFYQRKPDH